MVSDNREDARERVNLDDPTSEEAPDADEARAKSAKNRRTAMASLSDDSVKVYLQQIGRIKLPDGRGRTGVGQTHYRG